MGILSGEGLQQTHMSYNILILRNFNYVPLNAAVVFKNSLGLQNLPFLILLIFNLIFNFY